MLKIPAAVTLRGAPRADASFVIPRRESVRAAVSVFRYYPIICRANNEGSTLHSNDDHENLYDCGNDAPVFFDL
jgi:hypothetical protein